MLLVIVGEAVEDNDAENHDKQPDGYDDEQHKAKPTKDHGRCTDTRLDATVAEILHDCCSCDRGGMLP